MAKAPTLKLQPIGGKILVLPKKVEEKTKSGLYIPDTASKDKPQEGTIVALGTGKVTEEGKTLPFNVKVGQKVMFTKYSPDTLEVEENGETIEYLVMEEKDILAVIL